MGSWYGVIGVGAYGAIDDGAGAILGDSIVCESLAALSTEECWHPRIHMEKLGVDLHHVG
jgi:hypothetical protein